MSLRHALLGLLARAPASGYDLTKKFEGPLGTYAWQAGHTHIYPELKKMAADGLASAAEAGARGRRTYEITDAGRTELRRWLLDGSVRAGERNEHVLRLFLITTLDPEDARTWLTQTAEQCQQMVDALHAELPDEPDTFSLGRLAAEYGIRRYEAIRDWARWALEQYQACERSSS